MERRVYEEASRVAQSIVQVYKAELSVDGKWGSASQAAYDRLSGGQRMVVDSALAPYRITVKDLKAFRDQEKLGASLQLGTVKRDDIRGMVAAAAREAGIPEALLLGFVAIESRFNPRAVNGSSRGLGQLQPAAWADARKVNRSLPAYTSLINGDWAVWDPLTNARASAAYIKVLQREVNRLTGLQSLTPGQLYVAYQQGAGGFAELWNSANGRPVRTNYVSTERMEKNPPQDGKGVTFSKPDFYRRWVAVGDKKAAV